MSTGQSQSNPIVAYSEVPGIRMDFVTTRALVVDDTLRIVVPLPHLPSHEITPTGSRPIGSGSPFFNAGVNVDDVFVSWTAAATGTGVLRIVKKRVNRSISEAVTDDIRVVDDVPLDRTANRTYLATVRKAVNRLLPGESLVAFCTGTGLDAVANLVITIRYNTIVS